MGLVSVFVQPVSPIHLARASWTTYDFLLRPSPDALRRFAARPSVLDSPASSFLSSALTGLQRCYRRHGNDMMTPLRLPRNYFKRPSMNLMDSTTRSPCFFFFFFLLLRSLALPSSPPPTSSHVARETIWLGYLGSFPPLYFRVHYTTSLAPLGLFLKQPAL